MAQLTQACAGARIRWSGCLHRPNLSIGMTIPHPQPISLIVCDNVYTESTGKRALVGLFNQIQVTARDGPIVQRRLCVYLSMTEVYPGTVVKLDIVHGETDDPVVKTQTTPAPKGVNPTTVFDFQFEFTGLVFPDAGLYFVRFFGNDHILLQRPINVTRVLGDESNDNKSKK